MLQCQFFGSSYVMFYVVHTKIDKKVTGGRDIPNKVMMISNAFITKIN